MKPQLSRPPQGPASNAVTSEARAPAKTLRISWVMVCERFASARSASHSMALI